MNDFIAQADRPTLERHGLASFEALWSVQLTAVDEPNVERGGWSSVFRLELDDSAFYPRQSNHLTRTLAHPFGEPTCPGVSQYPSLCAAWRAGASGQLLRAAQG